jgi:hypothetical protein
VARKKKRATRHRECRERRNEEYRLREQQGLSSPGTEEYRLREQQGLFSSDEEEEEEEEVGGGRVSPIGGSPHPRHRSWLRWLEQHRLGRARRHPPPGN